MRSSLMFSRIIFAILIAVFAVQLTEAQAKQQPQPEWTPKGIDALRQSASSKTDFSLDHSMLVFAAKMDPDNADLQRVIAGVNAVTVHSYHFPRTWIFDPDALNSVKEEYQAAGWKQLMNKHDKDGGPGLTELWVRLENNAISNAAVLQAKSNEINFVTVSGSISPLDLSHLGGHFGIPKLEGGVVVPKTEGHP
ncbi:MAG: DUF4252 domain-containing protein [Terriglobales bacterium]|jgi:hypothetical protein